MLLLFVKVGQEPFLPYRHSYDKGTENDPTLLGSILGAMQRIEKKLDGVAGTKVVVTKAEKNSQYDCALIVSAQSTSML